MEKGGNDVLMKDRLTKHMAGGAGPLLYVEQMRLFSDLCG
jgi:hypothetical protein